ncbi:hypothetical protein [uncultured Eubacterium sp.]|uniref:hypothetical protein n=2 Tax=Eubacterium TaxID=1730 RepID=UPI0025D087B3|nr:hypothetical protein [uncultured Eubacterium sp.]
MIKISNREIIDVLKYSDDKVILVEKKPNVDASGYGVNYFILNFSTGEKEIITKDAYLLKKYGANRKIIAQKLGNFVTPSAIVMADRSVLVIYPTGETGLFNSDGELVKDGVLDYNGSPLSGIALDGEYFWSVCQKENCVIRYFIDGVKVDIRVGMAEQNTFPNPHFVSSDEENVYVCCNHNRIRKIDKATLTVSDVDKTYSDMTGYYRFGDYTIITTYDSAYCDKI